MASQNQNDLSNGGSEKSRDDINGTAARTQGRGEGTMSGGGSSQGVASRGGYERNAGRAENQRADRSSGGRQGTEQRGGARDDDYASARRWPVEDDRQGPADARFDRNDQGGGEMNTRGQRGSSSWDAREGPWGGIDAERGTVSTTRSQGGGARDEARAGMQSGTQGRTRRWRRATQSAGDIMTRNPKTARPADTVQQIAQIMVDEDTGIVPIVDEGRTLIGVVTDRDIVCRLVARGIDLRAATAREVMTDDVECVTERDGLDAVLRLMSEHQVRRIPVVAQGDRLVGIISMADLAREADVDEQLQDAFEDISSERTFWSRLR